MKHIKIYEEFIDESVNKWLVGAALGASLLAGDPNVKGLLSK
jgi:hypothetical protein